MAATAVLEDEWRARLGRDPAVPPGGQRREDGGQLSAGLGEHEPVARRMLRISLTAHYPTVDEILKPGRQQVARQPEVLRDRIEPVESKEDVAEDQRRPPVADQVKATGEGAPEVGKARLSHCLSIEGCAIERTVLT